MGVVYLRKQRKFLWFTVKRSPGSTSHMKGVTWTPFAYLIHMKYSRYVYITFVWDRVSLCVLSWPWTHNPPASVSQVLGYEHESPHSAVHLSFLKWCSIYQLFQWTKEPQFCTNSDKGLSALLQDTSFSLFDHRQSVRLKATSGRKPGMLLPTHLWSQYL
jgi:hypothetical protein